MRGYLAGSGLKDYQKTGRRLRRSGCPPGLRESDRLPEPIFTPATKAEIGHDENISEAEAGRRIGVDTITRLRASRSRSTGGAAATPPAAGIIVCDTKFEFGVDRRADHAGRRGADARLVALLAGRPVQPRQAAAVATTSSSCATTSSSIGFNKQPPGPALPADVVQATSAKYVEALTQLTGRPLRDA